MRLRVDREQLENDYGQAIGYVYDEEGGFFFTREDTLEETLASLEPDEEDPPSFSRDAAENALRKEIEDEFLDYDERTKTDLFLCGSARRGEVDRVAALLAQGADANARTESKEPALHLAAKYGHGEVVKVLLDNGAKVNAKADGWPALYLAAENGHGEVVKVLLDNGAKVNARVHGSTALHPAAKYGHREVVKVLLDKGAHANTKNGDIDKKTALHLAAENDDTEVVKILLDNGARVDARDGYGLTALRRAVENGHRQAVKILLDKKANPDIKGIDGRTYLHVALLHHWDLKIIKALLDKNAKINEEADGGVTPLHLAAWTGDWEIVKALLDKGANANQEDMNGRTPFDIMGPHIREALKETHPDVLVEQWMKTS